MKHEYYTFQDDEQILVHQVDEKGDVDSHMSTGRTDLLHLKTTGRTDEDILRMFNNGEATPGGIFDHAQAVKRMAGHAVNWTGMHTSTGFVFVVAQ